MDLRVDDDALRALGVELVVLFGSRARGTSSPDSDLDVGVLMHGEVPPLMDPRRSRIQEALGFDGDLDLVFLAEADPLLLFQIATDGKPLYERAPGVIEEFRIRAVKLYYDTAWIRRIEAEALRRRYA